MIDAMIPAWRLLLLLKTCGATVPKRTKSSNAAATKNIRGHEVTARFSFGSKERMRFSQGFPQPPR
jgi:hypothetical protein